MSSADNKRQRWPLWLLPLILIWQTASWGELGVLPRALPALRPGLPQVISTERPPIWLLQLSSPGSESERKAEKPRLTARLCLSAGLAVSSGLVAWWSKDRADRAYQRYLHAASSRRQEKQFERAERFDGIAGAAFVGMEAGLVFTTYLVFF
jgi:hypothetical protein